ncbi:hypothetical protein C353_06221 [Cryptococcus neoformans AD1-83a]|nr:hypothetical protein C353_06221 [Cryptococcus neoformans var. grubii AD1-83a]
MPLSTGRLARGPTGCRRKRKIAQLMAVSNLVKRPSCNMKHSSTTPQLGRLSWGGIRSRRRLGWGMRQGLLGLIRVNPRSFGKSANTC